MHYTPQQAFYVIMRPFGIKIYFPIHLRAIEILRLELGFGIRIPDAVVCISQNSWATFCAGYYQIPFDLKPGVYHLVVSGSDQARSEPVVLAEALDPDLQ